MHPTHPSRTLVRQLAARGRQECDGGLHTAHCGPWAREPAAMWPRAGRCKEPTTTAQSASSVPFRWGAPLKGPNVNATAKRSPTHRYAPGRGDVGPSREYARNTAKGSQRIAPPGVQTPTNRPLGPPLVQTRSDSAPSKGDAGNPTSHTPTDPPAPPATLRKGTSDCCPHAYPSATPSSGTK